MKLLIKKVLPHAILPTRAHKDDAGLDLYAAEDYVLSPMARVSCRTGIAIKVPDGYVGLVWDKSGLSHKKGLKTLGGVLDSGYTGELFVGLVNLSNEDYDIAKGQKIAQLLVQKIALPEAEEVVMLPETARGGKGLGSTGH